MPRLYWKIILYNIAEVCEQIEQIYKRAKNGKTRRGTKIAGEIFTDE